MTDFREMRGIFRTEPYPLVMVEWLDSRQPRSAWVRLSDFDPDEACYCTSVGWLIHDGKNVKALAPNMADRGGDDEQASGMIHIPTAAITRIIPLEISGPFQASSSHQASTNAADTPVAPQQGVNAGETDGE